MKKAIIFTILFLIVAFPINATVITYHGKTIKTDEFQYSFIPRIYFVDSLPDKCGWCFLSGVIFISLDKGCNLDKSVKHEINHAYFFKNMSKKDQIAYCNAHNLRYGENAGNYMQKMKM
jgi:hypothetical protein